MHEKKEEKKEKSNFVLIRIIVIHHDTYQLCLCLHFGLCVLLDMWCAVVVFARMGVWVVVVFVRMGVCACGACRMAVCARARAAFHCSV